VKKGHFSPQFTFTMAAIKPDRRPWPLSGRSGKFASGGDAASLTEREAVRDLFPADWKPKIRKLLLGFDARVDSGLYRSLAAWREAYERFSTFMDRFHVAGWRRWLSELVSEAATLGTAGAILLLALAIPAFHETSDDEWLKKSELAVTFLDRYGNEVGTRGIRHNDSVPLDQFPDNLIKAVLATEDRRFYDHLCRRHLPRAHYQCEGWRRGPGRLLANSATRQEPVLK
jgi:hypothetical protein